MPQASWRHQPPSFIIMASQGALAPRLARSIRALGHPYSSMWGTNTSPKRGDRLWVPHKRGMGSIAIVIRGMWKIDEKSWWHPSFHHGCRALQWRAWGRSCAPNTASRAPIFEYAGHWHVYQGSAAGEIDWDSPWRRIYDRPGRYGSKPRKSFSSWLDLLLKYYILSACSREQKKLLIALPQVCTC